MSQDYEVVVSREIGFGLPNRYPTRLDDLCHKHVRRESDRFLVCSAPYWTWTILQHHLESRVCVKQVQLDCKCATCSVAAQALGQHCKGVGCTPPGQAWPWDTCELWHVMVCGETKHHQTHRLSRWRTKEMWNIDIEQRILTNEHMQNQTPTLTCSRLGWEKRKYDRNENKDNDVIT